MHTTFTYLISTLLCVALIFCIYILYQFWLRIQNSPRGFSPWRWNSNSESNKPPGGSVGKRIELHDALEIIRNYDERRKMHTDILPKEHKKNGDSKSVFVDIQSFHKYLRYLERTAIERGIRINGLRFYFGAYGKEDKKEERGCQTLVIFPTVYDPINDVNFQAVDLEKSYGTQLLFIEKQIEAEDKYEHKSPATQGTGGGGDGSSGYNDMGSSPPKQPVN